MVRSLFIYHFESPEGLMNTTKDYILLARGPLPYFVSETFRTDHSGR